MQTRKSLIHKAGLAVGVATFLISSAQANPFQAELLKTGYGNDNSQPVQASDTNNVASDIPKTPQDATATPTTAPNDPDALPNPNDNRDEPCSKATDGKCGKDS
jgi:hypothetical protein